MLSTSERFYFENRRKIFIENQKMKHIFNDYNYPTRSSRNLGSGKS